MIKCQRNNYATFAKEHLAFLINGFGTLEHVINLKRNMCTLCSYSKQPCLVFKPKCFPAFTKHAVSKRKTGLKSASVYRLFNTLKNFKMSQGF